MSALSAEARQKFAERRRVLKSRSGVEERLVAAGEGSWRLEYWKEKRKLDELPLG